MEAGPTGTTEQVLTLDSMTGGVPEPPKILLSDLMTDLSILQQQENEDRAKFGVISNPDLAGFRSKLISWIAGGYQGSCDLIRIALFPPNVCSDGVSRNFFDYIQFVSGKSLPEHLAGIQAILPDFEVGYRYSRAELMICAVRVKA